MFQIEMRLAIFTVQYCTKKDFAKLNGSQNLMVFQNLNEKTNRKKTSPNLKLRTLLLGAVRVHSKIADLLFFIIQVFL